jgi:hypothetical protein
VPHVKVEGGLVSLASKLDHYTVADLDSTRVAAEGSTVVVRQPFPVRVSLDDEG